MWRQQLAALANLHCHIHGNLLVWLVIQEFKVVGCKRVHVAFVLLWVPDLQSLHDRQIRILNCFRLLEAEVVCKTVLQLDALDADRDNNRAS